MQHTLLHLFHNIGRFGNFRLTKKQKQIDPTNELILEFEMKSNSQFPNPIRIAVLWTKEEKNKHYVQSIQLPSWNWKFSILFIIWLFICKYTIRTDIFKTGYRRTKSKCTQFNFGIGFFFSSAFLPWNLEQ